ncbi:MAG: diaminopimelate decarboxylase [Planctomycetes bacterium]|nr:diaminopimelate decarboxylase [Planctomycetota bacterium]
MDEFVFKDGVLHGESVDLRTVAQDFGTPLYVYSRKTLIDHFDRTRRAFAPLEASICFSIKSCQNLSILRLLRERGSSFDVVSGGELARAIEAGADPSQIVFAGVGKRDPEIQAALDAGIGWFNVESEAELANIQRLAAASGKKATLALRVNPDVDPKTHVYTTTGKRETKFGVDLERAGQVFAEFRDQPGIDLCGIHLHLGSPVNTIQPYVDAITKSLTFIDNLRNDGHRIRAINIGGGFGAHYDGVEAPTAGEYAAKVIPLLKDKGLAVLLEPGRSIAANAGVLLTRLLYTKRSGEKHFLIVDAAITELLRPALYGAFHFVWPVKPQGGLVPPQRRQDLSLEGTTPVELVGPVCESGDFLAKDRRLPPVRRGDLICIFSAGAYGFTMSSQYNSRPRVAEILIDGSTARLIRRRETYDDLVSLEREEAISSS